MKKRNYEYTSYDFKIGMWILSIGFCLGIILYHAILTSKFPLMSLFPITVSCIFIYVNYNKRSDNLLYSPN